MKRKDSRRGSILILITLIMIISAIYVTTVLFDVRGTVDQERLYKTKKQIGFLQNAIEDYRINNNSRPLANFDELISQGAQTNCVLAYSATFQTMQIPKGWCGPYLDTSLFLGTSTAYKEDAWGTAFTLSSASASAGFNYTIRSCGEDASCGNADDVFISF